MFRLKTLTLAMTTIALMSGCSTTQQASKGPILEIRPVQETIHGQPNIKALYQLGRYYHGQMRYAQALESYRQALALQPQNTDVLTAKGVAYASLGQYDDALRAFESAAALQPNSPTALNNLGYIHWLRKEKQQSREAYRQALRLDPMNERTQQNLRMVMGDAANSPRSTVQSASAEYANQEQPPAYALATAPSTIALKQVSPQVFELTLPAGKAPALAQVGASTGSPAAAVIRPPQNNIAPPTVVASAEDNASLQSSPVASNPIASKAKITPKPQSDDGPGNKVSVAAVATGTMGKVEVLNGNGIKGIAYKTARTLSDSGYAIAAVGNYRHHNEARTRVEYLPGYAEQARQISRLLYPTASVTESRTPNGSAQIRLVLGSDFPSQATIQNASPGQQMQAGKLGVANGNGVNGMARKVAHYLSMHGYKTASVHNLRPFNKAVTQVEYRKGYEEQALKLGSLLPVKVAYSELNQMRGDVRLVLGHDIKQNMAAWMPWLDKVKMAEARTANRL